MIFVTVGSSWTPFDRLLEAVAALRVEGPIVVQNGASSVRPSRAACVDFLPYDVLVEHVRRARTVITHAGVGSVLVALTAGVRPLVVPRRACFGEAVDDHQVAFAQRLEVSGLVEVVDDVHRLAAVLTASAPSTREHLQHETDLSAELRSYIEALMDADSRSAGHVPAPSASA